MLQRRDLADLRLAEPLRRELLLPFLPPGAAFCRRTAARLHGIDLLLPNERDLDFPLEIAVPLDHEPTSRAGVVAHSTTLAPSDVVLLDGQPVTSLDRTLLDLARFTPPHQGLAILDRAAADRILDRDDLLTRLTELKGHKWVGRARRLVHWADEGAESPMESFARLRVLDAGFDQPETQIPVERPGGGEPYRLDFGWPERRKAVEYDGLEDHTKPSDRRRDARRRAYIASEGWQIVVVHQDAVFGPVPHLENAVCELLGVSWDGRRRQW